MAHESQRSFVALAAEHMPQFFAGRRVLEIGSLDVNGEIRNFFSDCTYIGLDVGPGRGVDIVCEGQKYAAPANSFDHVISCEAMEHNPYWLETFQNMVRLCKPGGLVLMTCATTGRPEHGTSRTAPNASPLTVGLAWNYYRNLTKSDFARSCNLASAFSMHRFWSNWRSYDLYFCGIKKRVVVSPEMKAAWHGFDARVTEYVATTNDSHICRFAGLTATLLGDRTFRAARAVRDLISS